MLPTRVGRTASKDVVCYVDTAIAPCYYCGTTSVNLIKSTVIKLSYVPGLFTDSAVAMA